MYQYRDHLGNVRLSYSDTDKDGRIADIPLFEDGFESASGWDSLGALYGNAVTAYDSTFSHSGNYSAKISTPAGDDEYVHSNIWIEINNDQPTAYTYSGWAYSDGPGIRMFLFMNEDEETGYYTQIDNVYDYVTKNQWVYFEKTVVVPAHIDKLNIRIESFWVAPGNVWFDDIKLKKSGSEIVEESNYYPFGLKHRGYNSMVNGTEHKWRYVNRELEESLDLNLYEMDFRNYDPALGKFTGIDLFAESFSHITPYHYAHNNPIIFKDPSGLFSTVVNDEGVITDHRKDGDTNIYLGSRNGPVVGTEEEGVEYNIGDKIFEVDNIVDTDFELAVQLQTTKKNYEEYEKKLDEFLRRLKEIERKLKNNIPLSSSDKAFLKSAAKEKRYLEDKGIFYEAKFDFIVKLLENLKSSNFWAKVKNYEIRVLINEIIGKIPVISSLEDPRDGKTLGDQIKSKAKTKASTRDVTSTKLPYPLPNYLIEN